MSRAKGKPIDVESDDSTAPAGPCSIEKHSRWAQVVAFLSLAPGENSHLTKKLRALARVEAESRAAGAGPDLPREVRRLTFAASEAGAVAERFARARLPVPDPVLARRDEVEDALAAADLALAQRRDRLDEIAARLTKVHGEAVAALHSAMRERMRDLAGEARRIVEKAPPAALRHPERLAEALAPIERNVRLGADLALAFSARVPGGIATAEHFWTALGEDLSPLMETALRQHPATLGRRPAELHRGGVMDMTT